MAISKKKKRLYVSTGISVYIILTLIHLIEARFRMDLKMMFSMVGGAILTVLVMWLLARFTGIGNWDEERQRYVNSWRPEQSKH